MSYTNFNYHYSQEFKCLIQTDAEGKVVMAMYMPAEDLEKVSFLAWVQSAENNFENLVKDEEIML